MKKHCFLLIVVITLFSACKKIEGPEGKKSLVDLIAEPAGTNCTTGGYKINSGVDQNNNGILDNSEIQDTKYLCNGNNGSNSLISIIPVAAGINCTNGGYKINAGIDINNNNVLDDNEIQDTKYICNGTNGIDGNNSLVSVIAEPAGINCSSGGYKINSGIDLNNNGILDNNEIVNTNYMCNDNKFYTAVLTQSGVNPPSCTTIANSLGIDITWTRVSQGKFKGTINKNLDLNKTILLNNTIGVNCKFISANEIMLENTCGVNAWCDDFSNLTIEILVFN